MLDENLYCIFFITVSDERPSGYETEAESSSDERDESEDEGVEGGVWLDENDALAPSEGTSKSGWNNYIQLESGGTNKSGYRL